MPLLSVDSERFWRWCITHRITKFFGLFHPGTHWIGGWVGPRAGLHGVEKTKFFRPPGLELLPFSRPARSQSLYRLRYPGSSKDDTFIHREKNQKLYLFLNMIIQVWKMRQVLSEQTSDSSLFLNAICLLTCVLNYERRFSCFDSD
jgi:hypothetical protein